LKVLRSPSVIRIYGRVKIEVGPDQDNDKDVEDVV
jgi:hypothetical protein